MMTDRDAQSTDVLKRNTEQQAHLASRSRIVCHHHQGSVIPVLVDVAALEDLFPIPSSIPREVGVDLSPREKHEYAARALARESGRGNASSNSNPLCHRRALRRLARMQAIKLGLLAMASPSRSLKRHYRPKRPTHLVSARMKVMPHVARGHDQPRGGRGGVYRAKLV